MKHPGKVVINLHTHLPYVLHHGDWPHGSDWLCEAVAECYLPLLTMCHELIADGITPNLSLDISPILCEQLEHPDFAPIFIEYCNTKMALALKDAEKFIAMKADPHQVYLAHYWHEWYLRRQYEFEHSYNYSIIESFKKLQDVNAIEILTCAATHGYLPLLAEDKSVALQIRAAKNNYVKHFGISPKGTWIPECAYRPSYEWKTLLEHETYAIPTKRKGIEEILGQEGLNYFFVDQQLFTNAQIAGKYPMHSLPEEYHSLRIFRVQSKEAQTDNMSIAFARHQNIALKVWSGEDGYPGDGNYLDFHKKHEQSAMRYWRVTDNKTDMQYKMLYKPDWVQEKVSLHAYHFIKSIESLINKYQHATEKQAILCLPFDTELFGHWWFEGPRFLNAVIRGIYHSPYISLEKCSTIINDNHQSDIASLPEGSWGENGNHDVWINPQTKWTWEKIYDAECTFSQLMDTYHKDNRSKIQERLLLQAMRELMLMQSSDWQFLITNASAKDYAEMRFSNHYSDFNILAKLIVTYGKSKRLLAADAKIIQQIEVRNAIFPELRLDMWSD